MSQVKRVQGVLRADEHVGGKENWRSITVVTQQSDTVAIEQGDAVALSGNFEVTNHSGASRVIGEALTCASENRQVLAIKVAGIAQFRFDGVAPTVDGSHGVLMSETPGHVRAPSAGFGSGRNLRTETTAITLQMGRTKPDTPISINGLTVIGYGSSREWLHGEPATICAEFSDLVNRRDHGVPGVTAIAEGWCVHLTADNPEETTLTVTGEVASVVTGGNVWVLL